MSADSFNPYNASQYLKKWREKNQINFGESRANDIVLSYLETHTCIKLTPSQRVLA